VFKNRISLLFILFFLGLFLSPAETLAGGKGKIKIQTSYGLVEFVVEYAISPEEKSKGLMHRKSLGKNQGMLFVYQKPALVTMWMKDTPISLDMFFINRDGRIRSIEERTQPNSQRQIHSGGQVSAVLELIGGAAQDFGIKVGDLVILPN